MSKIQYSTSTHSSDLEGILRLQFSNLPSQISTEEKAQEGFVTVHHDMELLKKMNKPYPHIIAKDHDVVVGYALVMLTDMRYAIPVLQPMFKQFDILHWHNRPLASLAYFVMGQVCIAKDYRGKGVFFGLYNEMRIQMSQHFDLIITEISLSNPRSIRAHEKVGFKQIKTYTDHTDDWSIVGWDWQ